MRLVEQLYNPSNYTSIWYNWLDFLRQAEQCYPQAGRIYIPLS